MTSGLSIFNLLADIQDFTEFSFCCAVGGVDLLELRMEARR